MYRLCVYIIYTHVYNIYTYIIYTHTYIYTHIYACVYMYIRIYTLWGKIDKHFYSRVPYAAFYHLKVKLYEEEMRFLVQSWYKIQDAEDLWYSAILQTR